MDCVWVGLWVGLSVDIAHYVRLIGYACKVIVVGLSWLWVVGWVTLGLGSYASLYDRFLFLTLSFVSLCSHPYGYISSSSHAATAE